jgi:predicted nucleic acid-binding Zn ribbon protein
MVNEAFEQQAKSRVETAVSLGDVLSEIMERRVLPIQSKFESISKAWRNLLPSGICEHCRIDDISGGRLKIIADSPSYMYELQLLSCELLQELSKRCPGTRIKEIKAVVG